MPVRNLSWYNLNAVRSYPLDDAATSVDDGGNFLPQDLLVDLAIRFPETLGPALYLSAATVTKSLVTCLFQSTAAGFAPAASISLPLPITVSRQYPVTAMADGVGGWVVFGDRAGAPPGPYSGRFSTPAQALISSRCARSYRALPVPGIAKQFIAELLQDVVFLKGGNDIEVVAVTRQIAGYPTPCIALRLTDTPGRNTLAAYVGPCGQRPESGTCQGTPLQSIGNVIPDCAGNVTIDFRGVTVNPYANGCGLELNGDIGLSQVCGDDGLPDTQGALDVAVDRCITGPLQVPVDSEDPPTPDTPPIGPLPPTPTPTPPTPTPAPTPPTCCIPSGAWTLQGDSFGGPLPMTAYSDAVMAARKLGPSAYGCIQPLVNMGVSYFLSCSGTTNITLQRIYSPCGEASLEQTTTIPFTNTGRLDFRMDAVTKYFGHSMARLPGEVLVITGSCPGGTLAAPAVAVTTPPPLAAPAPPVTVDCAAPQHDTFQAPVAMAARWRDLEGDWGRARAVVPASALGPGGPDQTVRTVVTASRRSVSVWPVGPDENPCYDFQALDRRATVLVQPALAAAGNSNGGLVVNWRLVPQGGGLRPHYYLVLVNAGTNSFEVWEYSGTMISRRAGTAVVVPGRIEPAQWYLIELEVRASRALAGQIDLDCTCTKLTGAPLAPVRFVHTTASYDPPCGVFGLGVINSHAAFGGYSLDYLS
jgi:hypothetical protein